jgi:peptidoglycan hydrolase-like protein with peptidoglycan-binding domain
VTTPSTCYWEDKQLNLYYVSSVNCSIDNVGAKTYGKKATAPESYVVDLQKDLIAIGYLTGKADGFFGGGTKRAVLRFQRRAETSLYRVKKGPVPADVKSITYACGITGICDFSTAKEIRLWVSSGVLAPLGRFSVTGVSGGRLRSDIAAKWGVVTAKVKAAGGVVDGPYGDTTRPVTFRKSTGGNSLFSLHYTGRAVDLNQGLAGGKGQRYYVVKEVVGSNTFWRIYCKTDNQKGLQGKKISKAKKIKYYSFWAKKEIDLPPAYYIDLTKTLKDSGFIRIKAHSNWKTNPKGTEWWHFHYDNLLEATFQDEMELIGHDEATLRKNGWNTNQKLDRKPG